MWLAMYTYDYESVNGKREAQGNLRNGWHRKEDGFAIARLQNIV